LKFDALGQAAQEKKILKGTVSKIADFGLFVDLGDFEGLVHVSEASWDRIEKLDTVFSIGQNIEVVVLNVERRDPLRNSRISLSIRQAGVNPWTDITEKIKPGESVSGTITRLAGFGAFVSLIPGVEGLIHISEMSWNKRVRHPSDVVIEGQKVNVTILSIDEKKRTVSCSLKDINSNPWNTVAEKYFVGSTVKGTVASETKYGFFIDIDESVTGLLTHGKIGPSKKGTIKKDDTIEVCIDEIDIESQRMSLSCCMENNVAADEATKHTIVKINAESKKQSSDFGQILKAALEKKK
jgi:small subunit ribosomal protein S1